MENLTRRQLLQAGAAGTVAAGIATVAGVAAAGAAPSRLTGIQVHGSLKQTAGPVGTLKRLMSITVFGPDDNLAGSGWDAEPDPKSPEDAGPNDRTVCYYTQHGSVSDDTVKLVGRVLFFQDGANFSGLVTTEASLSTGKIRWTFKRNEGEYVFEGIGLVGRV
jgi:hypothetical protein